MYLLQLWYTYIFVFQSAGQGHRELPVQVGVDRLVPLQTSLALLAHVVAGHAGSRLLLLLGPPTVPRSDVVTFICNLKYIKIISEIIA